MLSIYIQGIVYKFQFCPFLVIADPLTIPKEI